MGLRVFAVGAHPDDIEFMMAGTLLRLAECGAEIHYMHMASGSCGSMVMGPEETIAVRGTEARSAASLLGARYHGSLADDLEIYYSDELIRRFAAVLRRVHPECLLVPSTIDYMEDHQNTARIAVTAAFARGMPNYRTLPQVAPVEGEIAIYHAMPYGLSGPLGEVVVPEFVVDVSGLGRERRELLERHRSQRDWLDASQGVDSYVEAMNGMSAQMAKNGGCGEHAEGWRRRMHLGLCRESFRPLEDALSKWVCAR